MEEELINDPRDSEEGRETLFMLGVVYQRSDREEDAIDAFEAVLNADERHWRSRFHLATIAVRSAAYEEAEELLEQVLEDEPAHEQSILILAKLQELKEAQRLDAAIPVDERDAAQAKEHPGSVSDWTHRTIKVGPDWKPVK